MKILTIFFDIYTIEIRRVKSVLQFFIESFLLLHAYIWSIFHVKLSTGNTFQWKYHEKKNFRKDWVEIRNKVTLFYIIHKKFSLSLDHLTNLLLFNAERLLILQIQLILLSIQTIITNKIVNDKYIKTLYQKCISNWISFKWKLLDKFIILLKFNVIIIRNFFLL